MAAARSRARADGAAGRKIPFDRALRMDGLRLLAGLPPGAARAVFFDPQYRGLMEKMRYGNEGERQRGRALLPQMDDETIRRFLRGIDRVLAPSGHLFFWTDKFHLCEGVRAWFEGTDLSVVDLVTWDKERIGMGYRTRRRCEYLVVAQKAPRRAKGVWTDRSIPDVWQEADLRAKRHPHAKPAGLLRALLRATTRPGDLVVDPAAGSFAVLDLCRREGRRFAGCDVAAGERRSSRTSRPEAESTPLDLFSTVR